MKSIYEILQDFYKHISYSPYIGKRENAPRSSSKHQASKKGYRHQRRLSRGERNHLAFTRGTQS